MQQLLVTNAVQQILMSEVIVPNFLTGYWKDHRPLGHGKMWRDIQIVVTTDGKLGPVGFTSPRNYNLIAPDFFACKREEILACARKVLPSSTDKSVRAELVELARIIGGRLEQVGAEPLKLYRGVHSADAKVVSQKALRDMTTSAARQALDSDQQLTHIEPRQKRKYTRRPKAEGAIIKRSAVVLSDKPAVGMFHRAPSIFMVGMAQGKLQQPEATHVEAAEEIS